jgi:hypothetical protein
MIHNPPDSAATTGSTIREKLSKNPSLVAGLTGVVIIAAITSIVMQARSGSGGGSQAFYTVDDGKTYFTASKLLVAPFDKDGKQAVRAHVFMCGGKPVVGHLSRYTDAALKVMEDVKQSRAEKRPPKDIGALMNLSSSGIEVKKPGAGNPWIKGTDAARVATIRAFKCAGEKAAAVEIDPS